MRRLLYCVEASVALTVVVAAWAWSNFVDAWARPRGHGWMDE